MPTPASEPQGSFSYADYLTWPDDERWEIIDGRAYNMTPAPSVRHQQILGNLYVQLRNALHGRGCFIGMAPTDVVLSEHDVVQPDLFVVCDRKKITERNIQGAPDIVVEVLSPSTAKKDRWEKKLLYERSGVFEYLLLDPEGQFLERYVLEEDGRFDRGEILGPHETMVLKFMEGISIPLQEVFGPVA
jgi:Uma2 family endonuclease